MKVINQREWKAIENIVSNYKLLELPTEVQARMQYETERLIDIYGMDLKDVEFIKGNKYTIIYRDENLINDYELEVTKITPDYIYGIGGLVKYKKIRIVGVIIWKHLE